MLRTIVITGASAGIGEETAKLFAKNGWQIVLGSRREERLTQLARELAALGSPNVIAETLDVTNLNSVKRFCNDILAKTESKIDVLFNNAGLALGVDTVSAGLESDWKTMIDTNVLGLLYVTRALLPKMIERQHGHIINMGSIASHVVYEGGSVYCASKHAVRAITKTMRLEVNGTPLRVSLIDPGMVETDFSKVRFKNNDERASKVYEGVTPLTPFDIAECVWFTATRPKHVNIDEIVLMPVDQAAPHKISRKAKT
jgi:3-hydroxy acid dehydrogenase / malonic semialdehyde reductase